MREIKFRAWHKTEKKMYEVVTIHLDVQHGMTSSDRVNYVGLCDKSKLCIEGEEVDLREYTGLTDKHGREIYEGDIVRVNGDDPRFSFLSQIIFARGAFRIQAAYDQGFPHKDDMEVIGNIYENPELLAQ